jgi:putative sigma-54 modulation protein
MKMTLFFKNIKHTPALDYRIEQKSELLSKYFEGNFEVQWYCYTKTKEHSADVCIIAPRFRYRASASSENLYKCLDEVIQKLERQLVKKKEILRDKIHRGKKNTLKQNRIIELFNEEEKEQFLQQEDAC